MLILNLTPDQYIRLSLEEEEILQSYYKKIALSQEQYNKLSDEEKEAWSGGWRGKLFRGFYKDGTPKPYKTAEEFLSFQKSHIIQKKKIRVSRVFLGKIELKYKLLEKFQTW